MSPDETPRGIDRRSLLRVLGASGAVAGLAGCPDDATRRFAATPVVLVESALTAGVATERDDRALSERFTRSVGDREVEVTVESHLAIYDAGREESVAFGDGRSGRTPESGVDDSQHRTGAGASGPVDGRAVLGSPTTVGVLATPDATVGGQSVNPLATASLRDVLDDAAGKFPFADAGVVEGDVLRAFEPVGAVTPSDLAGAVTPSDLAGAISPSSLAGAVTPSSYERFVGVVRDDAGDPAVVVVTAGRDASDEDAVVVVAATRRSLPGADGGLANRPLVGPDGLVTDGGLAAASATLDAVVPFLAPEGTPLPFDPAAARLGPGELVSDGDDGAPDLAVAVRAFEDVPAESWAVYHGETVADHNPGYDPGEPVVLVAYESHLDAGWQEWRGAAPGALFDEVVGRGVKFHAFPRSRLRRHLLSYGD